MPNAYSVYAVGKNWILYHDVLYTIVHNKGLIMSLRVQFTLEKTELLYQQNAYCTVLLKNIGSSQLAVSVPFMDVSNP